MPHGGGEHVRPDFITERRWGKRFPITAVKPALPTQTPHTRPLTQQDTVRRGACAVGEDGEASGECRERAQHTRQLLQFKLWARNGQENPEWGAVREPSAASTPPGLPCLGLCFELILGAWGRGPIAAFIFIFWKFLEHLRLCPNEIEWYWSPIIMQIQLFSNEEKKNSVSYSPFLVLIYYSMWILLLNLENEERQTK